MGCDIHIYTEVRHRYRNNDWWCIDNFELNPYYGVDQDDDYEPEYRHREWYSGRDYHLFGLLSAGVRQDNPRAFEQRGFPDDCSQLVKDAYTEWGIDAHSTSWLTYKEIKEKATQLAVIRDPLMHPDQPNPLGDFFNNFKAFLESTYWPFELIEMNEDSIRIVFWFDN